MRSAPPALIALLNNSQQFIMADLYQITMANGTVLRYTNFDINVIDNGNTYLANAVLIDRSRVRTVIGTEVDTLDVTVNPHPADTVNGSTFLKACTSGALDGSNLLMRRAFFDASYNNVGSFINFSGRVADMNMTRSEVQITVKSDLELLAVTLPRNLYQATCLNTLYDGNCGLVRATWGVAGTVTSGSNVSINCGIANAGGYFDLGYIVFTSGALNGTRRTVKSYTINNFTLLNPLPSVPTAGDTFTAYAGCDKTQATCTSKFSNVVHFRGFPYIPVPETTR